MSKENTNQTENKTSSVIADLTVEEGKAEDVKGGPLYMKWGQGPDIKGEVTE